MRGQRLPSTHARLFVPVALVLAFGLACTANGGPEAAPDSTISAAPPETSFEVFAEDPRAIVVEDQLIVEATIRSDRMTRTSMEYRGEELTLEDGTVIRNEIGQLESDAYRSEYRPIEPGTSDCWRLWFYGVPPDAEAGSIEVALPLVDGSTLEKEELRFEVPAGSVTRVEAADFVLQCPVR